MGGSVYVYVCVNRARRFQVKKKFIRTSYNMIDELANQSIVNWLKPRMRKEERKPHPRSGR